MSCLGRERMFDYYAHQANERVVQIRLNYAVELRYGVLVDIARKVYGREPIDVTTGYVNVIWQGDANAYALRALALAETPPRILNVTGPETISVRKLALQFGVLLSREPIFEGQEQADALLNNAQQAFKMLGYPRVPLGKMIEWVAAWVLANGPILDKPTKFQARDGKF